MSHFMIHGACRRNHVTREYRAWQEMNRRCYETTRQNYPWYGGRGITVCERWRGEKGFQNFLADMGKCPPRYTLDRYPDKNGNYCKENCRWASHQDQCRNRRSNHPLTCNGETLLIIEWSERSGISKGAILRRIKNGWPVDKAIWTPIKK